VRLLSRIVTVAAILVWAFAIAASIYAWKTSRAVFVSDSRRTVTYLDDRSRLVEPNDVKRIAGRNDGSRIRVTNLFVDRWRGSIAIKMTSMTYRIDAPGALQSYYMDNGAPNLSPFFFHGEELERERFRFPLTADRWMDWDVVPKLPPPDYRPRYTFVRTNDAYRAGWDLEMRVPFWIVFSVLAVPVVAYTSVRGLRTISRRTRRLRLRCPNCNYDLRATPGRCPECGHDVAAGQTSDLGH
jgi:hypothetical protein